MHYFEHHIGDYDASTAHLSLVEDAIYHRLLRRYYRQEGPLPASVDEVARLIRARDQVEIVKAILIEFFTLADDGWRKERCDEAITKFREKASEAESEREHETERKRRYRERRRELFAQLREKGIVPDYNTPTEELVLLLSRGTGRGQDAEGTANQSPNTNPHTPEEKQKQMRTASRFAEFWSAYPEKKGKTEAEKAWKRKGLDSVADTILAHVARMKAEDEGWQAGYIPHGSTYVKGERWHDEPRRRRTGPQAAPQDSKTLTGMKTLQGMKDGLVFERDHRRPDEAHVLGAGSDASRRLGSDHGGDVD